MGFGGELQMINRNDIRIGTEISCTISGKKIKRAKLQIYSGLVYICQDLQHGDSCGDTLGYRYSWVVGPIPEPGRDLGLYFGETEVNDVEYFIYPEWDAEGNI